MMKLLVMVMLSLGLLSSVDPSTVRKINAAKARAEEAFKSGDYKSAIAEYKYLVDSLGVNEDEVKLNLANAYYLAKDTANAFPSYQSLVTSTNPVVLSKASQQLGVMANERGKFEEALNYFKQAIKASPSNDDARFNYEMLKKKLEEQKKQDEKQKQNKEQNQKDQQNKDQQDKENQKKEDQKNNDQKSKDEQNKDQQKKDQEQQEKDKKEQEKKQADKDKEQEQPEQDARKDQMPNLDRDKLEQMKITEEKARMILEAMKNQEKQYLQQQKRKASQSKDRNKPDW